MNTSAATSTSSATRNAARRGRIFLAVGLGVLLGAATLAVPAVAATSGITVYEARSNDVGTNLGSQANPTTVLTKTVPPGTYLVHGQINLNTQPGSYIVCALSNTPNGNDGIFGQFTNQWPYGAQENVFEEEVIKVGTGQSIHLTCDDNNGKPGDTVGNALIEAIPVSTLH